MATQEPTNLARAEVLEQSGLDVITSLAALHRTSPQFVPLALTGLPQGTRMWAETYDLIETAGAELTLTDEGRAMVAEAAERVPEPYADVTMSDLLDQTRKAVERLTAASSLRVETAQRQDLVEPSAVTDRLRTAGQHLSQRIALAVGRRERVDR